MKSTNILGGVLLSAFNEHNMCFDHFIHYLFRRILLQIRMPSAVVWHVPHTHYARPGNDNSDVRWRAIFAPELSDSACVQTSAGDRSANNCPINEWFAGNSKFSGQAIPPLWAKQSTGYTWPWRAVARSCRLRTSSAYYLKSVPKEN